MRQRLLSATSGSSAVFPEGRSAALVTPSRYVIQSGSGSSDIISANKTRLELRKITNNRRGNYYRFQKKLWPSIVEMEVDLTKTMYDAVERMPFVLLPGSPQPQRVFEHSGKSLPTLLLPQEEVARGETHESVDSLVAYMSNTVADKIISAEDDLTGTPLASAKPIKDVIFTKDDEAARQTEGVMPWHSLALDPLIEQMCVDKFGPKATLVQSRLLTALLNQDHNDVILNGVTGSGKTSAMMIALLSALRLEDAGLNIFVASSAVNGLRMRDAILSFVGDRGGSVLDRAADDLDSWLHVGVYREDFLQTYSDLKKSSQYGPRSVGPCRLLIATADVLNEILFEKKMEFEPFGYLRRVYVDDCGPQMQMPNEAEASADEIASRNVDPVALELLLGTLHQMPGPHIRSIMQIACVSADLTSPLATRLQALCIKPEAKSVVLSPNRLPSTIHCLFSFHTGRESIYEYLIKLMWNAQHAIPGRAIIFVRHEDNILDVRQKLRGMGMDAKILSEVTTAAASSSPEGHSLGWKFLLLRENEGWGLDLPLVSHVFISFAPTTWGSYLHMCGRVGRAGNVGWAFVVCDRAEAKHVRQVAESLQVNFTDHVLNEKLQQVTPGEVHSLTKEFELWGLDPQFSVKQHYDIQSEVPEIAHLTREMWTKPFTRQFLREDYTPIEVLDRRFQNAKKISVDVEKDPEVAVKLQKGGYLNRYFHPTSKLWKSISRKDDEADGGRGSMNAQRRRK